MEVTADGAKRIGTPRTRHVLRGRWIDWDHDPRMPSWPGAPGLPRNAANRPNTCMHRPLATTKINLAKAGPSMHATALGVSQERWAVIRHMHNRIRRNTRPAILTCALFRFFQPAGYLPNSSAANNSRHSAAGTSASNPAPSRSESKSLKTDGLCIAKWPRMLMVSPFRLAVSTGGDRQTPFFYQL